MTDHHHRAEGRSRATDDDGVDRRGFLKCMAWAGTGLVWALNGGLVSSARFGAPGAALAQGRGDDADFSFVQISDSHIGFSKEANPDVTGTLQAAIDKINALPTPPAFVLHTGDLTHLSKPEEFDTVAQLLKGIRTDTIFYTPGEHDVFADSGKQYLDRFGKGT